MPSARRQRSKVPPNVSSHTVSVAIIGCSKVIAIAAAGEKEGERGTRQELFCLTHGGCWPLTTKVAYVCEKQGTFVKSRVRVKSRGTFGDSRARL